MFTLIGRKDGALAKFITSIGIVDIKPALQHKILNASQNHLHASPLRNGAVPS